VSGGGSEGVRSEEGKGKEEENNDLRVHFTQRDKRDNNKNINGLEC